MKNPVDGREREREREICWKNMFLPNNDVKSVSTCYCAEHNEFNIPILLCVFLIMEIKLDLI